MSKGIKTSSVYFYIMVISPNNIKTPICVFYRMVRILFCLFTCVFLTDLDAQKYITAGGARLGEDIGISIQQRIAKHLTIEGVLNSSYRNDDLGLKLMLEQHYPLITRRFNVYYGAGVHWNYIGDSARIYPSGISLIGGIEFTSDRFNVSWDFLPSFSFWYGKEPFNPSTALTLRYVFIKEKKKKKHLKFWKKR